MSQDAAINAEWVPTSCTLPTADRPSRIREFDALFKHDLLSIDTSDSEVVRFDLRDGPEVARRVAELAARETACCSFFAFDITVARGRLGLTVSTDVQHRTVLAAMADRARHLLAGTARHGH